MFYLSWLIRPIVQYVLWLASWPQDGCKDESVRYIKTSIELIVVVGTKMILYTGHVYRLLLIAAVLPFEYIVVFFFLFFLFFCRLYLRR